MSPCTRRSILCSLAGASLLGGVSTTQARPQSAFESVWNRTLVESMDIRDSSRLTDGTLVVAGDILSSGDQSESGDIVAFDDDGNREWVWNWPEDKSDSLEYVQALAPTDEGGLFFAGPNDEDTLIGKLNAERNVEWHITHEQYDYHYGLFLVHPTPSHLTVVGFEVSPSISRTDIFGVDTNEQSVVWENDSFSEANISAATLHQQGCVVTGNHPEGGWTARVSPGGDVDWEQRFAEPELQLRDAAISPTGDIVTIGPRINEPEVVEILVLDSAGTLNVRRTPEFQPLSIPSSPQIVPDPNGGYLCSWTYEDRSELFVGKLTTEGTLAYGNHIEPWDSDFRPVLLNTEVANEKLVLFGDVEAGDATNGLTWGVGVTESTETPTPRETPTQTATDSSSPTPTTAVPSPRQASSTAKPSPTDVPNSTERERPANATSSANGPGFGILGLIFGMAGVSCYLSSRINDRSER